MKRMITALMLLCCLVRPAWAQMLETAAEFAAGFDAEYPPVGEVREETSWYGTTTWERTWTPDENGPDGVTYHARGGRRGGTGNDGRHEADPKGQRRV